MESREITCTKKKERKKSLNSLKIREIVWGKKEKKIVFTENPNSYAQKKERQIISFTENPHKNLGIARKFVKLALQSENHSFHGKYQKKE